MSNKDEKLEMKEYVLNPLTNRCCLATGAVAQKLAKMGKLSPEDMAKVRIRSPGPPRKKGVGVVRKAPLPVADDHEGESGPEVEDEPSAPVVRKGPLKKAGGGRKVQRKKKVVHAESDSEDPEDEELDVDALYADLFSSDSEDEE